MKILLTLNKTYRGHDDLGYWYTYIPLKELGHDVIWYDTAQSDQTCYSKIIESFKPDLIWCCLTGDRSITPSEPWEEIYHETQSGRTKTFNWFCDDMWRFESFSQYACFNFFAASTPEPKCISWFKNIGYSNILLGQWYANGDFYPKIPFSEREMDIAFIGRPSGRRYQFLISTGLPIKMSTGKLSVEQIFSSHADTQFSINLSTNDNDPLNRTQMKLRPFEVTAAGGVLLTQYHPGIENCFELDKEIISFESVSELRLKAQYLMKNPDIAMKIAAAGHQRFKRDHTSHIRLAKILKQIEEL